MKLSLKPVRELYGHTPAAEFGPKSLAAVRQHMVGLGWCRSLINRRVDRVRRAFKWAAAEELVPVTTYQALRTLAGLRKGRTEARESEPVKSVDPANVAVTLPFLTPHLQAMVELQRLTGMRPGEACQLRLSEVDRSGDVWVPPDPAQDSPPRQDAGDPLRAAGAGGDRRVPPRDQSASGRVRPTST